MNTHTLESLYDFPPEYPNFDRLREVAFRLLSNNSLITPTLWDKVTNIRLSELRLSIKTTEDISQVIYPVLELYNQEMINEYEIAYWLTQSLSKDSRKVFNQATIEYADHVFGTNLLAWGIKNNIFTQDELRQIRFDHGEHKWAYYGEAYVNQYLWDDFTIEAIMSKITNQKWLENALKFERQREEEIQELMRTVEDHAIDCLCC